MALFSGYTIITPPPLVPSVVTVIVSDDQPAQVLGGNLTRSIIRAFPLTLGQVGGSTSNLEPGLPSVSNPPNYLTNNITIYPNAWCDGPVCEPARAGIFTGSLDFHHTIHTNQDDEFFDETTDIANALYNAGWATVLFGKRFVNYPNNTGLNQNGPGMDGSGNPIVHLPHGYTYGFINVGEPVNPFQYTMITGPAPGFTPEQAWAGVVTNPGSCIVQAFDYNNTATFTASQSGTTLTVTGWIGPVIPGNLKTIYSPGDGAISPGMTVAITGHTTVTIVSQLTSTDPNGLLTGNGTYLVDVSQTFAAVSGCIGSQNNTTQNAGHNSIVTFAAYVSWLQANESAILAGKRVYGYIAPFSPHDPPLPSPQDGNSGGGGIGYGAAIGPTNLNPLGSFNTTGTNGPTFYAAQPPLSGFTNPTQSVVVGKVNSAEQAVLCIDRAIGGNPTVSSGNPIACTGLLYLFNSWGILNNTVLFYTTDQGINYGEWKWVTKRSQHDSTMRVPFFAFWGNFGPGAGINSQVVSQIDIVPTIAALASVTPPAATVDGVSIVGGTRSAAAWRWVGGDAGGNYGTPPSGDSGSSPAFDGVSTGSTGYFRTEAATTTTGTCTISIANPAVITYANNFQANQAVRFSTTGTLPTGITAGTTYYILKNPTSTSFHISQTSGDTTGLSTSGSQSGVHSITSFATAVAPSALVEEGLYNFSTCSTFTGAIVSGTLTPGSVTGDPLVVGHVIKGTGVSLGNYITADNGNGTFALYYPDTVVSEAMTAIDPYQMNNVQGVGGYAATKTAAIASLDSLLPNFFCVNDPTYVPATCTSGNLTLTLPVRARAGMLLVACIGSRGTSAPFTIPGDWTVAAPTITSSDTANGNTAKAGGIMVYQIYSGTPTLTFTRTGGGFAQGEIMAYEFNGTLTLEGGQSAQATGSNQTTVSVSGFTSTKANQMVLVFGVHPRNTGAYAVASTLPAISSGTSNSLSRTDPYSAPQVNHWTQKDNQKGNNGNQYVLEIWADALLAQAGQSTGAISYQVQIGALPTIMAATFSAV